MKKITLATFVMVSCFAMSAQALTIKSGQVLGSDGKVYDGATPQMIEALKKQAARGGKTSGVSGSNFFLLVDDDVVFVPIAELAGKATPEIKEIISTKVIQKMTGLPISYDEFQQAQKKATEEGVRLSDVLTKQLKGKALKGNRVALDAADVAAGTKLLEDSDVAEKIAESGAFDRRAQEDLGEQLSDLTLEHAQELSAEVDRISTEHTASVTAHQGGDVNVPPKGDPLSSGVVVH